MVLRKGSSNWKTYSYTVSGFGCDSDWYFYIFPLSSSMFPHVIFNIHWQDSKKLCTKICFNILQPHLQRCRVLTASIGSNGTCGSSVSLKIRPLILKMCINYSLGCNSSLDITIIYILLKKYIFHLVHCACS